MCDAVEGRFLQAGSVAELQLACRRAEAEGAGAVFLSDGPLGDAVVLAAGLRVGPSLLLGVCTNLEVGAHRHPTVLAREMTTLDHLCGGRTILVVGPAHGEAAREALTLCRAMFRQGLAMSEGPVYPVPGAVNRPGPPTPTSPRLALDLTDGGVADPALLGLVDLVLMPTETPGVCLLQPV
jgi:alkanesulfonate monooxygenase SsuD/methylene tetrahydromethanopterin reductase-like flavin-dependent oxidoreductase (luciferase family)